MIDSIRKSWQRLRERPALIIFLAVMTLITSAIELFNPFTKNNASLSALLNVNLLKVLNTLAEKTGLLLRTPKLLLLVSLMILLLLVAVSAIVGISCSGFFHQFLRASDSKEKKSGEIRTGISRHAFKLSGFFFTAVLATTVFFLLLLYTVVPAVLSVKLFFTGSSSIFFPMLLICILTILVDFFAILFYTMYISFAVPSLVCFRKGGFGISCRMVNAYCWYLIPRTLLFLVLNLLLLVGLLAIHYGSGSVSVGIAVLIPTWLIRTLINYFYLNFIFNTFVAMKSDMFDAES